jgi:hypothetical protein
MPAGNPKAAASGKKQQEKLPLQQRILNGILNVSNVPYRCALRPCQKRRGPTQIDTNHGSRD